MERDVKVKSYLRKGKLVRAFNYKRKASDISNKDKLIKSTAAIASVLGVSVGSYLLLKNRYNKNLIRFGKEIRNAADASFATKPIKPDTKSALFTIGGISTTGTEGDKIGKALTNTFNKHEIIPFHTKYFTKKESNSLVGTAKNTIGKIFKPFLFKGYNPDSVELAKKAYSYHLKYPELPLNFIGHSGGGSISKDVNEMLINAGVPINKLKVVTLGTPDIDIIKKRNNVLKLSTSNDFLKPFMGSNVKTIQSNEKMNIKGHYLNNYIGNKEVVNTINDYLNSSSYKYANLTTFNESKVKQYIRRNKKGKLSIVKSHNRDNKERNKKLVVGAVLTGAVALGLSAGSYRFLVNRYRSKLKDSAKWVVNNFNKSELDEGVDKFKRLHFAVGGLTKSDDARKGNVFARKLKDTFDNKNDVFIPVDLTSSQKDFKFGDKSDKFNLIKDSVNYLKKNLFKGYNPTSRELAAKIYKINKLYPDKEIAIHGFSSGSPIALEVENILKNTDINIKNIKLVHYAGDHAGILKPNTEYLSFHKPKDPFSFNLPFKNSTPVSSKHTITDYMENDNVINKVKQFLNLKNDYIPTESEKAEAALKAIQNTPKRKRKPIFNTDELKKEIEAYRKTQEKKRKLNDNTKIPAAKRAKAEESANREVEKARNRIKQLIANIRKQNTTTPDKTS